MPKCPVTGRYCKNPCKSCRGHVRYIHAAPAPAPAVPSAPVPAVPSLPDPVPASAVHPVPSNDESLLGYGQPEGSPLSFGSPSVIGAPEELEQESPVHLLSFLHSPAFPPSVRSQIMPFVTPLPEQSQTTELLQSHNHLPENDGSLLPEPQHDDEESYSSYDSPRRGYLPNRFLVNENLVREVGIGSRIRMFWSPEVRKTCISCSK